MLKLEEMSPQQHELKEIDHIFKTVGGENSSKHNLRNDVKEIMDKSFLAALGNLQNPSNSKDYHDMKENYEIESENLINLVTEQIQLQSKNLSGRKNGNRYSPLLLQLATTIYTRSNATYRQVENYLNLPSISLMAQNKATQKVNSGMCSEIYIKATFQMCDVSDRVGVLVGDEMKLKAGIWSSVSDHRMIGFAEDQLNFNELIEAFKPNAKAKEDSNVSLIFNCMALLAINVTI